MVGGAVASRVLTRLSPNGEGGLAQGIPKAYQNKSKMEVQLGTTIWDDVRGKTVVDFGCGPGIEVVEMAEHGARHVIGLDHKQTWLDEAAELAGATASQTAAPSRTRGTVTRVPTSSFHWTPSNTSPIRRPSCGSSTRSCSRVVR
jgi:SAM-dependent methyltransferase